MNHSEYRFWKKYFRIYDVLNEFIPYETMLRTVAGQLSLEAKDILLDIGCGTGNLLSFLPKDVTVVASDLSTEALSIAKAKEAPEHCWLLNMNLKNPIPFRDSSFNKIAMINVLYAFTKQQQYDILCEVKRVLEGEGKVVIVIPKPDTQRSEIFKTHLNESIRKKGYLKTIYFLFSSSYRLFLLNKYNKSIVDKAAEQQYFFWEESAFTDLLTSLDFYEISVNDIYARQGFLYSFRG